MGAVVADAGSVESRCHTRDIESRCDLWAHGDGMGRVEHDGRPTPRASSRNDHDVAGWTREALVDATVLRVRASNRVKPEFAAGRNSKGRGRSVTATSPDRQPRGASRPGVWSLTEQAFLQRRSDVLVEEDQRLSSADDPDQPVVNLGVEHGAGEIFHP